METKHDRAQTDNRGNSHFKLKRGFSANPKGTSSQTIHAADVVASEHFRLHE